MHKRTVKSRKRPHKIDDIQVTSERLTGRGGLAFFVAYLQGLGVLGRLEWLFGGMRKSGKGIEISELFKQLFCFMMDGTSRHMVHFDHLKRDEGYAGAIETDVRDMASSHAVKRFLYGFSWVRVYLFRRVLQELFMWRLNITQPLVVELGIDTMVMDNDDAEQRHGVKPTYKNKKGFQPLQMNWGRFFVDAVFRGGNKHSNHGDTVERMIRHMVKKIRKSYRPDVPIIIRMDSGFFDQKIFEVCEELHIGYICGGKLYKDVTSMAAGIDDRFWSRYRVSGKEDVWEYVEFGSKRGTWKKFRRALYCRLMNRGPQLYLSCCRPDTVIVTNLGLGGKIDDLLRKAQAERYLDSNTIIGCYHERGSDELVNRAFKDFGHEQLPFKRFNPNAAWYYTMLLGHFLYEAFKEDVCAPAIPLGAYATTVRRQFIDIAGKIVTHGGKIILKVMRATSEKLRLPELWERCHAVPILYCT